MERFCPIEGVDKIILASRSPRRQEILKMMGVDVSVVISGAKEHTEAKEPGEIVRDLAGIKASSVAKDHPDEIVVGADTIVWLNGKALGKPKDEEDAFLMLSALSGRMHEVYTGVCICKGEKKVSFFERTEVLMYENSDELLRKYIATKEPMDKAGAYGIQGYGMVLIKGIRGDYYNVMGLPAAALLRELEGLVN